MNNIESNIVFKCPSCGSNRIEKINEKQCKCKSCLSEFIYQEDQNSEYREYINKSTYSRNIMDFEEAYEYATQAMNINKTSYEPYFYRLLALYGVTYIDEKGEGIEKPTMSRVSPNKIESNNDYIKVIELLKKAPNDVKKNVEDKLKKIEKLRNDIISSTKNLPKYDIFICYKRTANSGEITIDSSKARDIYDYYSNLGYKVFLAEKSLGSVVGTEYEPIIYNALHTASVMLVIAASSPEYIEAPWVKNEWRRFLKIIEDSKYKGDKKIIIPVLCNGFNPYNLPMQLQKIQSLPYEGDFYSKLDARLKECVKHGLSSMFERKKQGVAEIKPIEIEVVPVTKREIKTGVQIVMSTSEKTSIDNVWGLLDKPNPEKYVQRAIEMINRQLKNNNDSPNLNWVKATILLGLTKESDYLDSSVFIEKPILNEVLELLIHSFENSTSILLMERIELLSKLTCRCFQKTFNITCVNNAIKLYEIIVSFVKEKYSETLTKNILADLMEKIENGNVYVPSSSITNIIDCIYPILSKFGAKTVYSVYSSIGKSLVNCGDFSTANRYFKKALDIFAADPTSLFFGILSKNRVKNTYLLGEKFNETIKNELIEAFTTMLKGGQEINDYFKELSNICVFALDKNREMSMSTFKQIYELIPADDEYYETRFSMALYFADLLCVYNEFETAEEYYIDLIASDNLSFNAYFGLLKCHAKCRTAYELLSLKQPFDTLFPDDYWNLTEVITQLKNSKKGIIPFASYCDMHDRILQLPRRERKRVLVALENATKICKHDYNSPDLTCVDNLLSKNYDQIIKGYTSVLAVRQHATNNNSEENIYDIYQVCKNAPLRNKEVGISFKREFSTIVLPLILSLFFSLLIYNVLGYTLFIEMNDYSIKHYICYLVLVELFYVSCCIFADLSIEDVIGSFFGTLILFGGAFYPLSYLIEKGVYNLPSFVKIILCIFCIIITFAPYLIGKLIDIYKKRSYINKKYIIVSLVFIIIIVLISIIIGMWNIDNIKLINKNYF